MTSFGCLHCFQFLVFFAPKTGGRLKIALPEVSCTYRLFCSDFLVKFMPCQLQDVLFLFGFNIPPLADFVCILWLIILHEYKSSSHKLCFKLDCMMLQYVVIASLIQLPFMFSTLQLAKDLHTITEPPLCFFIVVT